MCHHAEKHNQKPLFLAVILRFMCVCVFIGRHTQSFRLEHERGEISKCSPTHPIHPPVPPTPLNQSKVEALGTGVWAAPRGGTNAAGAGGTTATDQSSPNLTADEQSPTRPRGGGGTVPLVTVETICVVDLRENKPPSGGGVGAAALTAAMENPAAPLPPGATSGAGGGGGSRAPVFATSVLPGDLSATVISRTAGGGGVSGSRSAHGKSDKVVEKMKREAATRRRTERRARDREERRCVTLCSLCVCVCER